jgi:hypothetical protein
MLHLAHCIISCNTLPEYSCHWPQDATTASDLG